MIKHNKEYTGPVACRLSLSRQLAKMAFVHVDRGRAKTPSGFHLWRTKNLSHDLSCV
jgi:hypothetical protein